MNERELSRVAARRLAIIRHDQEVSASVAPRPTPTQKLQRWLHRYKSPAAHDARRQDAHGVRKRPEEAHLVLLW